jgi:hypothetical protein
MVRRMQHTSNRELDELGIKLLLISLIDRMIVFGL